MDANDYLATLRKHWWFILLLSAVGLLVAFAANTVLPTQYTAKTGVFVSASRGETTSELVQGSTFTQNLVQSYALLVTTPTVLDPVIEDLELPMSANRLGSMIEADTPLNTVFIEIRVRNADPRLAADIADAVAAQLAEAVADLSPTVNDEPAISMSTVAPASVPVSPTSPNTPLLLLTGIGGGLLLGLLVAFGRELLDTRIRSDKDIERITPLPLLGKIAKDTGPGISTIREPQGRVAEDFRRVRVGLEFVELDASIKRLLVTSASPKEGKSTSSINLALALALVDRDRKVLLIDADLRRPTIAEYTQLEGAVGLTSVLIGDASSEVAIQAWSGGAIDVLTAGTVPPNPDQLLGSAAMRALLEELDERYDIIVIDSPPLLPVADTLTLSGLADAVLVVARHNRTTRPALQRALGSLASVRSRVVGVLLNSVPIGARGKLYYGYSSNSSGGSSSGRSSRGSAPVAEAPVAEAPAVEESAVEESTVEEPTVEEPTVEEPTVEEPTAEEPAAEEPAVEEPAVEEPAADADADAQLDIPADDAETPAEKPAAPRPATAKPRPKRTRSRSTAASRARAAAARRPAGDDQG